MDAVERELDSIRNRESKVWGYEAHVDALNADIAEERRLIFASRKRIAYLEPVTDFAADIPGLEKALVAAGSDEQDTLAIVAQVQLRRWIKGVHHGLELMDPKTLGNVKMPIVAVGSVDNTTFAGIAAAINVVAVAAHLARRKQGCPSVMTCFGGQTEMLVKVHDDGWEFLFAGMMDRPLDELLQHLSRHKDASR